MNPSPEDGSASAITTSNAAINVCPAVKNTLHVKYHLTTFVLFTLDTQELEVANDRIAEDAEAVEWG
jgi:hypothetical protein